MPEKCVQVYTERCPRSKVTFKMKQAPHSSQLVVLFYLLFVCKCVLYCCHRVATQLQFNKHVMSSHSHTPQSVGLLWTSDKLVTETSTLQNTRLTRDKFPWDSNPQSQQANGLRPTPQTAQPLGPALKYNRDKKTSFFGSELCSVGQPALPVLVLDTSPRPSCGFKEHILKQVVTDCIPLPEPQCASKHGQRERERERERRVRFTSTVRPGLEALAAVLDKSTSSGMLRSVTECVVQTFRTIVMPLPFG